MGRCEHARARCWGLSTDQFTDLPRSAHAESRTFANDPHLPRSGCSPRCPRSRLTVQEGARLETQGVLTILDGASLATSGSSDHAAIVSGGTSCFPSVRTESRPSRVARTASARRYGAAFAAAGWVRSRGESPAALADVRPVGEASTGPLFARMGSCGGSAAPRWSARERGSRLLDAAGRARAGEVTVALVAGEAGIGKTRLLQEMAARLEGTDLVLVGHGVDLETGELPFGVLGETLRNLVRQVGMEHVVRAVDEAEHPRSPRCSPVLDGDRHVGSTNQATNRLAMLSSALTLFETLARERTLCWLVEDLQWVDASTRDVLSLLCRTVSDVRLLVVGSVRTDDPGGRLRRGILCRRLVPAPPHAEVITLRRLDPHDVHDQLTGIVGVAVSPGVVERVVELSDGVPFLVEELAATGGRPDLVTVAAMTEVASPGSAPRAGPVPLRRPQSARDTWMARWSNWCSASSRTVTTLPFARRCRRASWRTPLMENPSGSVTP